MLSNRIELTAIADSEILAGFDVRAPFMTAGTADYVQDGLIAQWDGIENVGQGLQHDSAAAVWKDLVGTRDLPLVAGRGSFTSNALYCAGGSYAAGPTNELTGFQTIEVVCGRTTSGNGILFDGGLNSVCFTVNAGDTFFMGNGRFYRFFRSPTTLAWRSGARYTADGVAARHTLTTDSWSNNDRQLAVGARITGPAVYPYKGEVHAIRVYDRALTDAELAHNFLLDSIRFFGRERPKRTGSVLIVR